MAKTYSYKDTYLAGQTSDGLPELSGLNYDILQIPLEQNSLAAALLQSMEHLTFSDAKPFQAPNTLTETLSASIEHDTSGGAEAHDTLHGSEAHDTLHGSDSDDTLGGGESHDTLNGGDSDDHLETEETHVDSVHGSEGNDHLESNHHSGYTEPVEAGLIGVTHDADLGHTDFLI
jgi:Ca2+-binding RTX toxin-like protein